MSTWEENYRQAASIMVSPEALDERILQQARTFRPPPGHSRIVSGTAGSFAAIAVLVLLIHPAQYLGALTPGGAADARHDPLNDWQLKREKPITVTRDPWVRLRSEIRSGNYVGLCEQWRKEQRGHAEKSLPRDLVKEARAHCRLLPQP